jgi:hypothetical protein
MNVKKIVTVIQIIVMMETLFFNGLMLFRVINPPIMIAAWFMPLSFGAILGLAALRIALRKDS